MTITYHAVWDGGMEFHTNDPTGMMTMINQQAKYGYYVVESWWDREDEAC